MINLNLEIKEVETLLQSLAQMPYGQVVNLFNKIQQQAQQQLQQEQGELTDKVVQ